MKTLRESVSETSDKGVAIGHFNISNIEALWGIFNAARKLGVPVIIGTSEGERDFIGAGQAVALVKSLREQYDYPIFINADHTYSFDRVKEAIDLGYDSVIFDGTELPFEENVKITKRCVDYARKINPEIIVEAELGFIGKSSKILDEIPSGVKITEEFLTKPEEAKDFVEKTRVDLLAPAVGNIHGMLKGGNDPALNIEKIREIRKFAGIPLVLHGGSGNSAEDFKDAIDAGVSIIHINTEIRVAYRKGLQLALQENPDEVAPYKYLKEAVKAVEKVTEDKLRIFNNIK
ncbi:MAG: class II fructose-bisphosphate aldolase [Patescibacteria group bacterium]|nr:class II fructose-bisphosphate aldolase family protein [Patescibacteria group bacterium]MDE1988329.1 class II fructose-bisphosphate aldolase [Patescibacteria group bacterium]MDE2218225.1 class II fructose-bisphosphate aldolase [Patescibacteria group bacterium]